ncbi:LysR family transcriptional regulator [Aminipila luticellarii]|uniref:LysR family transcriptional regulator n=1 Tax=Aminipila luticellarii TaxID=2507160 RepID=A0A410PUH3_9FIRM|nr:LysR family transcriptional regulator [Aminipila luticellarii]QAT42621.1 LysR family transcriptional regulator [Aminipila luticellarii]
MGYTKYKAFLKVVELSSFTKAGKCLGYTQSAISQMINSLEEELHTTLLSRNKSGIKITNEGMELLPFIKDVCDSYDTLQERAISMNNIDKGIIKIGLIHSVAYTWLSDVMAEFKLKYPNVQYEWVTGSSKEIQAMVKNQNIDFGFSYCPVNSELIGVKLAKESLCLLTAKNTPVPPKMSLDELAAADFIWFQGNEEFNLLEEIAAKKGIRLKKGLEAPDLLSSVSMAERNLGLAVSSQALAEKFKDNLTIIQPDFDIKTEIAVVLNDLNRISRTGKCFLDLLVEKYCE